MRKSLSREMVDAYLLRRGLSDSTVDAKSGEVKLVFSRRFRVSLVVSLDEFVILRSRIGTLPPDGIHRDRYLVEVARLALLPALRAEAACSVDPEEGAVWLQTRHSGKAPHETLVKKLNDYLVQLRFWRSAIKRIHY